MRILILSQWYPPEPMKLLSDMAEGLTTLGHRVTVLTGFPNWPSGKIYDGYRLKLFQEEWVNGVRIVRVPLFPDHSRSAVRRALNFLSFALAASLLGPWTVRKPDIIHVIHPPITVCIPALVLSLLWRIPFTMEIQDMWPENLRSTGMLSNEKLLHAIGSFARWIYSRAAAVRVISPGFRENLLEKGVPEPKIHVISNWVDIDFYSPVTPSCKMLEQFDLKDRFNVLYAGTIGLAQGLEVVLEAATQIPRTLSQIQFVLAGDGIEYDRLLAEATRRNLENVKFLGRLPGSLMPSLYSCADVLMLHLRADPLFSITIPHKVFTYMAAAKPILLGGDGDTASLISKARAGVICPPSDPGALAQAVIALHAISPIGRREMGDRGRQIACEQFSRSSLIQQLSHFIEAAAD